ncbi:MAG: OmpH family outer membrane protein [Bacteroidota bacterium]
MKKNLTTLLILLNTTGILVIACYLLLKKEGYVYVETYKVYEGFVMKKQMQGELESEIRKESERLDSLRIDLKMALMRYEQAKNEDLKKTIGLKQQELAYLEQQAKTRYEELADKYDARIWAQINQYVMDYGKEQGQEIIFGASGNGSVMYGKENRNVTEEVIGYMNKKHKDL